MSNKKQKVIFVGGTAYSGSTFFHLILANDPHGFACGELKPSLHPQRAEHIKRECSCYQPDCSIWPRVIVNGEKRLYSSIFNIVPDIRYVVDSSKNPLWIYDQSRRLRAQGVDVSHVLIWKSPDEFGQSMKKRNRTEGWVEEWIRYHKLYFSLMDEFVAVQYRKFTQDRSVLVDTCRQLGLEWFEDKAEYWNKVHHSLGGNYSARIHLYEGNKAEDFMSGGFDADRMKRHRSIYYLESQDPQIEADMNQSGRADQCREILDVLNAHDVSTYDGKPLEGKVPCFSPREILTQRAKYMARIALGKYKFSKAQSIALSEQPITS